jgi:hypothetical protein
VDKIGQISPDGQSFWDGQKWLTTLSPDGKWRWDGESWVATSAATSAVRSARGPWWIPGFRTGKAWKLPLVAFGFLLLLGGINSASSQPPSNPAGQGVAQASPSAVAEVVSSPAATASPKPTPSPSPSPSPSASPSIEAPAPPAPAASNDPYPAATKAGATAVCADGSWSFSKTRSGTCSGHGGVHWWTGNLGPAGPGAH